MFELEFCGAANPRDVAFQEHTAAAEPITSAPMRYVPSSICGVSSSGAFPLRNCVACKRSVRDRFVSEVHPPTQVDLVRLFFTVGERFSPRDKNLFVSNIPKPPCRLQRKSS